MMYKKMNDETRKEHISNFKIGIKDGIRNIDTTYIHTPKKDSTFENDLIRQSYWSGYYEGLLIALKKR